MYTRWEWFLPVVNFVDNIRQTLTNQEKIFPLQEQSLTLGIAGTNAHGSSCHAVDDKQMLSFITEYLTVLNPTPLSLQTVM